MARKTRNRSTDDDDQPSVAPRKAAKATAFDEDLDPSLLLTGMEAREILRICDKTQVAFANFIGHSATFVRGEKILGANRYVRLQWVRALQAFVSDGDYHTALAIIRQHANQRGSRR